MILVVKYQYAHLMPIHFPKLIYITKSVLLKLDFLISDVKRSFQKQTIYHGSAPVSSLSLRQFNRKQSIVDHIAHMFNE